MNKISLFLLTTITLVFNAFSAVYYVSPQGDDAAAGTLDKPFKTPQTAFGKMASSDTVFVRGGSYSFAVQVKPSKAGTVAARCNLWAYQGEKPVFDFTGLNDRGLYISKDYWYMRGIEVKNAGSNGICLSGGGGNILEGCVSHDNGLEGIKLTNGAHDDLILNCDSYRNYDAANHGENADGFAAKSGIGTGNVFRGCRSWLNSDDGWDLYGCPVSVMMDSCFAFRNGMNVWNDAAFAGDGNAFKVGGAADTAEHRMTHCVAFDNAHNGFDQNYNNAGQTMYNCTSYRNGTSNFSFYQTPTAGKLKKHVIKNCISYLGGAPNIDATAMLEANSWPNLSPKSTDFLSFDTSLVLAPRGADYTLPKNGFLRLQSTSQFVDKGVNVGLPYFGKAPDFGAFETSSGVGVVLPANPSAPSAALHVSQFASGVLRVNYSSAVSGIARVSIIALNGKNVLHEKAILVSAANNLTNIETGKLPAGVYCCRVSMSGVESQILFMLQ